MPDCTQSVAFQMRSSFESEDFCHGKAKICTEYEAISKIFNVAGAKICLSKPYAIIDSKSNYGGALTSATNKNSRSMRKSVIRK